MVVSRCWALVALLVLTGGCKERNPEWLGPASQTGAESSSTGSPGSTGDPQGDSSSTGDPIACNNDNQCPDDLVCGPVFCQMGIEGDPCDRSQQCAAGFSICSSTRVCQDGSPGDPCMHAGDCAGTCEGDVCG